MSKMDGLRAMREAKYAANAKRTAAGGASAPRKAAPVAPPVAAAKSSGRTAPVEPGADTDLCGHRNMSGRTCTRERGHAAKSHRYS
jgi:hypothetical protein